MRALCDRSRIYAKSTCHLDGQATLVSVLHTPRTPPPCCNASVPLHMLRAPDHKAVEALFGGHGDNFGAAAIRDKSRRINLRANIFQSPTIMAGPARKNDNAVHAELGCMVLGRLDSCCAGSVSNRPGPI